MIRIVTLVNVFANLNQDDLTITIGCQGWLYFEFVCTVDAITTLCQKLTCVVRFFSDHCLPGDDAGFTDPDP